MLMRGERSGYAMSLNKSELGRVVCSPAQETYCAASRKYKAYIVAVHLWYAQAHNKVNGTENERLRQAYPCNKRHEGRSRPLNRKEFLTDVETL